MKRIIYIAAIFLYLLFSSGCKPSRKPETRTRVMFDTIVSISIYGRENFDYERAFETAWRILSTWEEALDAYDTSGALYIFNSADTSARVPSELAFAVRAGLAAMDSTDGAFDIRVGELMELWNFSAGGNIPTEEELQNALKRAKLQLTVEENRIVKSCRHPRLDVGGLAKGLAADAVYGSLKNFIGVERFLVDLGGNIRCFDRNGGEFKIGIRHTRDNDGLAGEFELQSGSACATAGDYQRYFIREGVRYAHILDPATGKPARKSVSVTVVAPTATEADIYSTALFVMGPDSGMAFVARRPWLRATFIDSTGAAVKGNIEVSFER